MFAPDIQNAALSKMTAAPVWHPHSRANDASSKSEVEVTHGNMYPSGALDDQVQGSEDVKDGNCMTGCSSSRQKP